MEMKLRKIHQIGAIINRGFLILWATAIFWFYLGNLINFHQNRIWGKVLIPSCFTHSSVNNKDFGSLQNSDHDSFTSSSDCVFDAITESAVLKFFPVTFNSVLSNYTANEATEYKLVIAGFSYRGPPAA
jgi:hypothetical protein